MKLDLQTIKDTAKNGLRTAVRYRVLIFFLIVGAVYGYVVFMIGNLSSAEPSPTTQDSSAANIRVPKVDQSVVRQLETLRDNNVSVQTLFEQARDNPFNE